MAIQVLDKTFVPFINAEALDAICTNIALQIDADYATKKPLFLVVLNGAFMFASDLFKKITIEAEISFIRVTSYKGMQSTETVEEILGIDRDIAGRHIILVEDIVDTGLTIYQVLKGLKEYSPASVSVCTLLNKPDSMKKDVPLQYIGMKIANDFVVGYGLDYDGFGRNLNQLYVINA